MDLFLSLIKFVLRRSWIHNCNRRSRRFTQNIVFNRYTNVLTFIAKHGANSVSSVNDRLTSLGLQSTQRGTYGRVNRGEGEIEYSYLTNLQTFQLHLTQCSTTTLHSSIDWQSSALMSKSSNGQARQATPECRSTGLPQRSDKNADWNISKNNLKNM